MVKNKLYFLILLPLVSIFTACKKSGVTPNIVTDSTATRPLTINQLLIGKWLVVKDSVQTLDYLTPIQNIGPIFHFNGNDFIVFKADSMASVSSLLAVNALFPQYHAYNTNSELFYTAQQIASMDFKYNVLVDYITQPSNPMDKPRNVYAVTMQNINPTIGYGFEVVNYSATNLELYHKEEIPTALHDYVINEYIYLEKLNIIGGF